MDDERLAQLLVTVGSTPRLALLRALRVPRALHEIEVEGARPDAGGVLSRQSVRAHLERLIEAELVLPLHGERSYGQTTEFLVNHARIYALGEDLKSLSRYRAAVEAPIPTSPLTASASLRGDGPRLVLVKGLDEGRSFALEAPSGAPTSWVVGRRRGVEISLDFDPFVSGENAVVESREGRHTVTDIPGSRNGTWLNFERLAPSEGRGLRHGDIIGVGRSALVYWT